jgi:hypothetical protein
MGDCVVYEQTNWRSFWFTLLGSRSAGKNQQMKVTKNKVIQQKYQKIKSLIEV